MLDIRWVDKSGKNLASSCCPRYTIHQHNFGKKNVASTEQLKRYIAMAKCADSTGAMGARQRQKGTWTDQQSTRRREDWGISGSPPGSFLVFHPSTRSKASSLFWSNPICSYEAAIVAKSYRRRRQIVTNLLQETKQQFKRKRKTNESHPNLRQSIQNHIVDWGRVLI